MITGAPKGIAAQNRQLDAANHRCHNVSRHDRPATCRGVADRSVQLAGAGLVWSCAPCAKPRRCPVCQDGDCQTKSDQCGK